MKTELTPLSNRAPNLFAFASSSRCECEKDRFWLVIHFDRKIFSQHKNDAPVGTLRSRMPLFRPRAFSGGASAT
jgi:hypothetical protein